MARIINLLETQVSIPKANIESYSWLFYGRPKAGKTSLFVKLIEHIYKDVKKGFLVRFEEGANGLKNFGETMEAYEDFITTVNQLIQFKDRLGVKVVGIDTIDEMFRMATKYVLKKEGRKDGTKYNAVNDIPWGKGWEYIECEMMEQLLRLKKAGYGLVLITHEKTRKFESRDGVSYDQTTVSLPDRIRNSILNLVDFVNFIDVAKEKDEKGKVFDKRYIYFRSSGSDIEAGSRFSNVPERIEYNIPLFYNTFENAVLTLYDNDKKNVEKIRKEQELKLEEDSKKYIANEAEKNNKEEETSGLIEQFKTMFLNADNEKQQIMIEELAKREIYSLQEEDLKSVDVNSFLEVINHFK